MPVHIRHKCLRLRPCKRLRLWVVAVAQASVQQQVIAAGPSGQSAQTLAESAAGAAEEDMLSLYVCLTLSAGVAPIEPPVGSSVVAAAAVDASRLSSLAAAPREDAAQPQLLGVKTLLVKLSRLAAARLTPG